MATIRTAIELDDRFSGILNNIVNAVNMSVSAMEQMQATMNTPVDPSTLDGVRNYANQATIAVQELDAALKEAASSEMPAPAQWQSDTMDVFTNTGAERFEQEIQSANNMLNTLNQTQTQIAETAAQTNIFSPNMVTDMNGMQDRLQAIQQRIQAIENNPLNMGSDVANAELEQLRGQLDQAVQEQEMLNRAVENMDVQAANQAYLRLSQTVSNTERYIRDNVDEQGRFNRVIQEGVNGAESLAGMIKKALGAYVGIGGVKKAFSFIQDSTASFDTQLNSEIQLISVLSNTIGDGFAAGVELETTADTTAMTEQINAAANVSEAVVSVTAETNAVTAAFNDIKDKAAEIQSQGIYGDEAMIAAGAEFSTYFTDTGAIEMMMDTLADYAAGMSGGGAIDKTGMVDYATGLGKIMTGSYDAMTKKGFEFTDVQKAIIEGTATQEQIAATIGEEYIGMSQDMQAAAAISAVIGESWDGLYEKMSNTPEGKIIQMSNAWGDMKEVIGGQLYPYIILFVDTITENWGTIEMIVQGITIGLQFLLGVLSWVMDIAFSVANVFVDNWSTISAVITPIAIAVGLLAAGLLAYKVITGIAAIAQNAFNSSLLACPITWILLILIAVIAAIFAIIDVINKVTGSSISAVGIIMGALAVAGAFIWDLLLGLFDLVLGIINYWVNPIIAFVNFFGNVFNDPIGSIIHLFGDLADNVLGVIQKIASALDFVFGSHMADTVQGWRDGLSDMVDTAAQKYGNGKYEEIMSALDLSTEDLGLSRIAYKDAWNAGYEFGEGLESFDPSSLFNISNIPSAEDYANVYSGVNSIDDNTANIADSLSVTDEELKYLRDIAERETINRFTTAEITIEQTNNNNISSDTDLDGIVNGITDAVTEAVFVITEGVHV